ncbi:hypothetical protein Phi4:1_gp075 [Cellulophaga phage phi4:1]|uniref:Uncharacterized protein n=5 Tax=Lightbulbvirus TaxID=1918522 RepID=A0A0S2MWL4_9CAUD|nr:hypothetical protein Phi4:1_gp075 [Cellulophaga phage phi4:1]YP_008241572.1 hypothetical protein Phi17:2_gp077 [Cellulophaga phage phi17:2]ALO80084.1 hypothetical protein Phi4113_075 [Cellulophaga phage phi4:1_13]ALO80281.1 hypothetical protein Phi4118_075 [Cellulophaga phage phi4:1_18]ALO80480.1 hypothetical protein Phi17218_077 [Cellulophaga phage phi17:2_18]AGO47610.1 hypothetical protein Phi17:2_gp077 [Cellulophaga phage phi17:2]AGO49488.1 hypothetical protein Phi4:1_gp075 [Cellulophag
MLYVCQEFKKIKVQLTKTGITVIDKTKGARAYLGDTVIG